MIYRLFLLFFLFSSYESKETLKILVYNTKFGHSHSVFLGNIADILSEEGHNVTSLIPEIYPPFADGTTKSKVVKIPVEQSTLDFYIKAVEGDFSFIFRSDDWDKSSMIKQMPMLRHIFEQQCNYTLTFEKTIDDLRREKFDVMIAETFDYCGIGLSHLISPRSLITVSTTNIFDYLSYQIGQPLFPSHVSTSFGRSVLPHSLTSRIDNLIAMFSSMWMFREMEKPVERVFKKKYGEDFPNIADLIADSAFTLTNSDPFLDFAKPTLKKVIEIGGIGVRKAKQIDEEWESILSLRSRTVVVSFGTVARAFLMPLQMKKSLAKAFSRFSDTTFVWKYEKPEDKDEFAAGMDNVILREWLPQNDLLEDDRVRGFLTHAGKGSFFEAASRGKSSLLVPLFGDQLRNAAAAEFVGFGKLFDKADLEDADKIEEALREILDNEERIEKAREVKRIMDSRPFTPRELLVRHVEFAAKFGPQKTLQSQGRQLSYLVYYNIDIIGIIISVLFVLYTGSSVFLDEKALRIINLIGIKGRIPSFLPIILTMIYRLFLLFFLFSSYESKETLKILVYNTKFGHSHSVFLGNIADILSEEGHNVTSLIPEIYPPFADGTTKSKVVKIPVEQSTLDFYIKAVEGDFSFIFRSDDWDKSSMIKQMPMLRHIFEQQCNYTLTFEKTIDDLRREKFDVMIAETFDYCGIGLSHLISPRSLITVSTTNIFDYLSYQIGQPLFPSHVSTSFGRSVLPHSLTSRIDNLIAMFSSMWMFREMEKPVERVFKKKYGEDFPNIADLIADSAFTLTNSDPFLDFAKPTLKKVIEIGGIGVRKAKQIDEEWESILSLRSRTVVVSFGTVARAFLMPLQMKKSLAKAFSRFSDTTFVWKYEKPEDKDEFAAGMDNVILREWLPQNDLLEDDRVRGFLTHAGKGSFFEAASRGKSSLLVPLFGDQLRNAAAAEFVGFGKLFDKADLEDADKIEEALREILDNEERIEKAREVKRIMDSRPFTPRELLVRHVEFAAKFGPQKTLQSQGRQLSYLVYYNIDIIGIIISVLFVLYTGSSVFLDEKALRIINLIGIKGRIPSFLPIILTMIYRLFLLFFLFSSYESKETLKILVYNTKFGHSHSVFLGNIADILSEEGHNVTSLIPEIYPPFADGTTKSKVVKIPVEQSTLDFYIKAVEGDFSFIFRSDDWDKSSMIKQMPMLRHIFEQQCNYTLTFEKTIDDLRREKFDVMIAETFDYCGIGLSHLISPRSLITVSTTNIFDYLSYQIGQPLFPSHVSTSFGRSVLPHSLTSRIDNLIAMFSSMWMFREMEKPVERVFKKKYGEDFPNIADLIADSAFTLTNSDPFLDFAKPTLKKVIEIGGIGVRKAKQIDEEWESILSLRSRTVVVSFGTVARAFLMPLQMKKSLAKAFSRFSDTTFVWKYEKPEDKDEFAAGMDNVILREWLPQNDLLEDDRVRGFLTHAGKGSFFEAASRGKSSLLVPLFGDQLRNAAAAEFVGFGKLFDKADLEDADKIEEALREILDNEERIEKAREVKRIMDSRPFTPRELLVRHVEFAAKDSSRSSIGLPLRFLRHSSLYTQPPSSAPTVIATEGESNGDPSVIIPSTSSTQVATRTQVQPPSLIYETPSLPSSQSTWNPSGGYAIAPQNIAPIPIGYGQYNGAFYNQPTQPIIQNPYYRSSPMYPQQFYPQQQQQQYYPQQQQFYPQAPQQGYFPSYGEYPQGCYPRFNTYRNGC
ncbi:hypothetical protein PRIPAC_88948 [Pristionchus pacificus]|uniref:glucuronosyltransferase n=1 Tax=Pristionchus pacificus TaxID=54126 RepID=A0A2A6CJ53_PRIPA|nr:hypothetical protein PRIPAC_88948 [Pristionchus pacificus]|eukprot:PDM78146.1 Glycosyltransferase [Pristionchus pacificus]